MARRKKPENETVQGAVERRKKEAIADASSRSEKTSWNRKMDKMVKLLASLRPIEQEILELTRQKMPVFDEIHDLRETMVRECIHPFEYLVVKEDHMLCKFCEKRIRMPVVAQNAPDKVQT